MKKFLDLRIIFLCLFATVSYAKTQYIPEQLDQFKKTGICVGCDLSEANLPGKNNADLNGALLVKADLYSESFYTSNFSNAQMMYANLTYTKASGSNFNSADLTGANLANGNFSSCDFTGANFSGADLTRADLARAIATPDQLAKAKSLSCAIMPDGARHAPDKGSTC